VLRTSLHLGLTSFGGPLAHLGYFERTYDFARRLRDDPLMAPLIGSRLELVNGKQLLARLKELGKL
jgi:hypothetical protein